MPDEPQPNEAVEVFYSYSHKDEKLRDTLEEHLSLLERQRVIGEWYDRRIGAGREWAGEIDEHLKSADLILLLISSSFIASDYCYDVELTLAMERHEAGEARVVPVILRPCDWQKAPFGKLNALPRNAKPVTKWANRDEAFTDIADGIRRAAEDLSKKRRAARTSATSATAGPSPSVTSKVTSKAAASSILRPPVVGFVARRDKQGRDIVELLVEELSPDKNRLVALWGPGGVGKTTLAVEVVQATKEVFGGRLVWASSLQRADFSFSTLLDEIATQLGREDLRRLAPEPKAAQVAALVSEAPALVILDNFETVAEEEQTRCLDFLAQSAACPVLITTRAFVDRDDVTNVELDAMDMEEAREFLHRLIARTPKSQNFADLDRDDLIRKCEANPLLLQWVVRQIVLSKTPQSALDYLSKGEGDAAERVFTRSFNLPQLGDDGRSALLALSLFTPTASREALAEVSGFGDDLRRLDKAVESLSSLWLVETTESNKRFFLRGLTRELAKSCLSKDSRDVEFRRRYIAYFLRHAKAHAQRTPEDFDALEIEKDNMLAAVEMALGVQDWGSLIAIRSALTDFLELRGYWDEAVRSGEQAQTAAREAKDDFYLAYFKTYRAQIHTYRGEYEEAGGGFREAIDIFRSLANEDGVASCLQGLGNIAFSNGELDEAERFYSEGLEINKKLGQQNGIALTGWGLGNVALRKDKYDEAKRLFTESLDIFNSLGQQINASGVLNSLSLVAYFQNDMKESRRLNDESLSIARSLGSQQGIANSLRMQGWIEEKEGDREKAAQVFREALTIFEKLGSPEAERASSDLARVGNLIK